MEYDLNLERSRKYKIFYALITGFLVLILFAFYIMGFFGFIAVTSILIALIITPFVYNKYKFFLILWLFVVPFFDNFRALLVFGTSPVVYLATGLTIPFALIMFFREKGNIFKALPFLKYLMIFQVIMILNFFRPGTSLTDVVEVLKIFIQIFTIFCTYFYLKENSENTLDKWINLFVFINCAAAIFQRITGIGLWVIEGLPRVNGFIGHPNVLAFYINLYLPYAIYKFLQTTNKKEKNIWIALIVLSILTLILTLAKVALFTFAMMSLILFLYLPVKFKIRIIVAGIASLILVLAANFFLDLHIFESILARINNASSYEWRLKIWNYLASAINLSNITFGHGINQEKYYLFRVNYGEAVAAHNGYLQLIFDYGLTSIFFYLSLIVPALAFFKEWLKAKKENKIIFLTPLIIIMSMFINMLSDNSVFLRTPMCFAWLIITVFYLKGLPTKR